MKKKVIEGARKLIKKLFEAILDREAFIFEAPKAFTRNFSRDMLTDDQLEVIDSWKAAVRGQLNTAEKLHADKRGLADHGDTYFEMLPLPAPNIIVMCDKCLIRYEIEVFAYKKGVLLSAVQAAVSENGVGIAGINLSGKERALVQTARQLAALDFLKNPIYVDRMSQWRDQLSSNTRFLVPPSMEQVTAALRETPIAVVWAMHTAVLASLMPLLEDDAKPFFYPALRLSENETAAQMQRDLLRNVLSGFTFGRSDGQSAVRLLEISLQEKKDIQTLEKVNGLPVLVNLDSEPVQRELTRAVQNSHCELLDSGISKHPLNTLPLLTGDALPAENAIFALDWPTFENVNPAHVAVLRNAFGALMKNAERLAALISEHIGWLALDGIRYEQAYLWAIAQELDGELFGVTEHTGPLTDWVQHLIATRENQQAERQRRFAMALDIVRDTTQYDSLVAPDASEMTPEQLGFRYIDSQGETFIAFELKEDFPKFMTRRLGLRAGDSVEFRRYLVQNGIMKTVSKNVRGRSRDSISHALICLSTGCEAGE